MLTVILTSVLLIIKLWWLSESVVIRCHYQSCFVELYYIRQILVIMLRTMQYGLTLAILHHSDNVCSTWLTQCDTCFVYGNTLGYCTNMLQHWAIWDILICLGHIVLISQCAWFILASGHYLPSTSIVCKHYSEVSRQQPRIVSLLTVICTK